MNSVNAPSGLNTVDTTNTESSNLTAVFCILCVLFLTAIMSLVRFFNRPNYQPYNRPLFGIQL